MPKKQKLINFKKEVDFQRDLQAGELLETSIIFVDDAKKIYTHGTEFNCSGGASDWDSLKNKPFGEEVGSLLYERDNLEFEDVEGDYDELAPDTNTVCPIEEGKLYRLTLGDQHFDLTCKKNATDNLFLATGDVEDWWEFITPNGGKYFFRCDSDGLNGTVGKAKGTEPFDKVEIHALEINTIDPKFLPIVQECGNSEDLIMSQLAVKEEIKKNASPFQSTLNNGAILKNADNVCSGEYSVAEGDTTKALGDASHTEGYRTKASGYATHAEGFLTEATGDNSHAEGNYTQALGENSHTEGTETIANNDSEHACGKYNISSEDTLFSIGNGEHGDARHNAFEVKENGEIYIPNTLANGATKPMIKLQDNLFKSWIGTQAEYDALTSIDPDTFYFIKED